MHHEELTARVLRVWAPEWYERPDFLAWLNHPLTATWRQRLTPVHPKDTADAFTWIDSAGDGSDVPCPGATGSPGGVGLPPDIWRELVAAAGQFPAMVWLSNEFAVDAPIEDELRVRQRELDEDEFADIPPAEIHFSCDD